MSDPSTPPPARRLPLGSPSHIELGAPSGPDARAFFGKLFGWPSVDMGGGNSCATTSTLRMGIHPDDEARNMIVYFAVADLEAAMAEVRALGGKTEEASPEEPGFGRFCACTDPQGVRFGLHQQPAELPGVG